MEIGEIISDSMKYPLSNIKALLIYAVISIVAFLILVLTGVGILTGANINNFIVSGGAGILGVILFILIYLLIVGYGLDVIKYGINRDPGSPGIDFGRQIANGAKYIIVGIVYMIVPAIITLILNLFLKDWLISVISFILVIVFGLALFMAQCRLAKTDSLGEALNIGEAIGDIGRVGLFKLLAVTIIIAIIIFILFFIVGLILQMGTIGSYIGAILMGVLGVYIVFVTNRAPGLLYSDV